MTDDEESTSGRIADSDQPTLVVRMIWVFKGGGHRIIEHGDGLVERDAVLLDVRGRLAPVPLEAHGSILAAVPSSDLFQVRVLQRQALAADGREADGHNRVRPLALHADDEPFPPAGVTHARADLERQALVHHGLRRRRVRDGVVAGWRRLATRVERVELGLRHLPEEARRLSDAVAVDATVERVREVQTLAR